jgi:CheY-like chemotaxis protein
MSPSPKPHILIVEDDKKTAGVLKRALHELGEARIVGRVDEVFQELLDFQPLVVLLDIRLEEERVHPPGVAGVHILRRIRDRESTCHIPVIVMTGLLKPEIEAQCRALGVTDFLRKTFSMDALLEAVQKALKQQWVKIFIGYTPDMEAEAWTVKDVVVELDCRYQPQMLVDYPARPAPPSQLQRQAIQECDLLILLVGGEYGRLIEKGGPSLIEDGYDVAQKRKKPILAFANEVVRREARLKAFLARLEERLWVTTFSDLGELRAEIRTAVGGIELRTSNETAPDGAEDDQGGGSTVELTPDQRMQAISFLFDIGRWAAAELKERWTLTRKAAKEAHPASQVAISAPEKDEQKQADTLLQDLTQRYEAAELERILKLIERHRNLLYDYREAKVDLDEALLRREIDRTAHRLRKGDLDKEISDTLAEIEKDFAGLGLEVKKEIEKANG